MEEGFEGVKQENPGAMEWASSAEAEPGNNEQTVETISEETFEDQSDAEKVAEVVSEETFKKIGESAQKAVDLDALREEVEEKVIKEENPNAGYEILAEGREEVTGEAENGE